MALYSYSYCIPYIVVFSLFILLAIPLDNRINYNNNLNCRFRTFLVLLLFLFFFAFRGFVYTDSFSYYDVFNYAPPINVGKEEIRNYLVWNTWENGYLFTNIIFKTISSNYFLFQFFMVLIDLFFLYNIFNRYHINIPMGFAFYFVFGLTIEINLLRNVKAILIFFYSLKYIELKDIKKYFLSILIACFFHVSAVIFFPLYFVLNKKYSKKNLFYVFLLGYLIFFARIKFATVLLSFTSSFVPGRIGTVMRGYLKSKIFSTSYGISIGFLERFCSCILFFIFYKKMYTKNLIISNIFIIYLLIYLYFSDFRIIIDRVPLLFVLSYCIYYPTLYKNINRNQKVIFLLCIIFYAFVRFGYSQNTILTYYDNIILGMKSYSERKKLLQLFQSLK